MDTKLCSTCRNVLPRTNFSPDKSRADGLKYNCRPCTTRRVQTLKYGLTNERVAELLAEQNERCAICREQLTRYTVDHDHDCCDGPRSCGECVRGLLCGSCNAGLGFFKDNADRLISAAIYLLI